MVGHAQMAFAQEAALAVHDVGVTISHTKLLRRGQGYHYPLQRCRLVEGVTGIHEDNVVGRSQSQSLVHGIVDAAVRFADYAHGIIRNP